MFGPRNSRKVERKRCQCRKKAVYMCLKVHGRKGGILGGNGSDGGRRAREVNGIR